MPFPLDGHFDLDARAGPRIRRGDGGNRDVPLQERRPATARGPTDLAVARVQWHLLAPRLGGRLGGKPHVPVETLHRLPVNFQADRPPRRTASLFLEERLPPDERPFAPRDGPVQAELQRRIHLRVDDCFPRGHILDLRQNEPASIRAMSSASIPAGVMSCPRPFSRTASHSASARSRSTQISYPRSPVYPVREMWTGIPSNFVRTNRKYFSFWTAPSAPSSKIARDEGPWRANAPMSSETSFTSTSRPIPAS